MPNISFQIERVQSKSYLPIPEYDIVFVVLGYSRVMRASQIECLIVCDCRNKTKTVIGGGISSQRIGRVQSEDIVVAKFVLSRALY